MSVAPEDKPQFHPLSSEWVLWEHLGGSKDPGDWKENMKQVCSFSTAEDFWRYFNFVPKPSEVFYDGETRKTVGPNKIVEGYSLFKKGIEPEWDDPQNKCGGEFFCRHFMEGEALNMYWQNLVLAVVGETMENEASSSSAINGARVVDKGKQHQAMFKLELWISSKDPSVKEKVRDRLMKIIADGCPTPKKGGHPRFDWKGH
eukprot:CAMPEP_0172425262 /NCGR_PEP_ID=MMETSP1064-20121228/31217_1 /TAXON_ID=202472 /ORGANISM="Aulacoseira subarctica , Strain CCAP 1002/5" /LENGTH=201 /DNA_ID=CAMNT_0013167997 /DNA_START=96 /DNA_END=701 /DNA_ORIENTATION=-